MRCSPRWNLWIALLGLAAIALAGGCKKKSADPFPASNAVAGWEKTNDTHTFDSDNLWRYIDGDSDQYVKAGVVSCSTSSYTYQNNLEAVVDVYTMGDSAGARRIFAAGQGSDAQPAGLGDASFASAQSITFRKGPYLVRIVGYESLPGAQQALLALAHGIESKL